MIQNGIMQPGNNCNIQNVYNYFNLCSFDDQSNKVVNSSLIRNVLSESREQQFDITLIKRKLLQCQSTYRNVNQPFLAFHNLLTGIIFTPAAFSARVICWYTISIGFLVFDLFSENQLSVIDLVPLDEHGLSV